MTPKILSSPMMDLRIIDKILENTTLTPEARIPLLEAKITLLTNSPSSPLSPLDSSPLEPPPLHGQADKVGKADKWGSKEARLIQKKVMKEKIPEFEARISVSRLYLLVRPLRLDLCESELLLVERGVKEVLKLSDPKRRAASSLRPMGNREHADLTSTCSGSIVPTSTGSTSTGSTTDRRSHGAFDDSVEKEVDHGAPEASGASGAPGAPEAPEAPEAPDGDEEMDDEQKGLLIRLREIRIDGLRLLLHVEEALGRDGRARRWRELIGQLEKGD